MTLKLIFLLVGLIEQIAQSGRCVTLAETPDARVATAIVDCSRSAASAEFSLLPR